MNLKKLLLLIGSITFGGGLLLANGPQYNFSKQQSGTRTTVWQQDSMFDDAMTAPTSGYHYTQMVPTMAKSLSSMGVTSGTSTGVVSIASRNTVVSNGAGGSSSAFGTTTVGGSLRKSDGLSVEINSDLDLAGTLSGVVDIIDGENPDVEKLPTDPDDPGIIQQPVGEGLWTLLLLVGGYALTLVRKRRKE